MMLLAVTPVVITGFLTALFAIVGCVILIGRGDGLIAGYNTASKEKKQKVNIKRLRFLTAILCWLAGVFCMLMSIIKDTNQILILTFGFVGVTLVFLILANTWAKKK